MSLSSIPEEALFEIRNVQQVPGEPKRRWFFSHEMDLIVWLDEEDRPISFQLSYDKYRNERAIRWNPELGYSHHKVQDEQLGTHAGSALLTPAGAFDATSVRARFLALSPTLPWVITEYVADRLRLYQQRTRSMRTSGRMGGALVLAALVAIPIAVILALGPYRDRRRVDPD